MELTEPLLRAEWLQRRYHGRLIVDVAALVLHQGEVLAVLGPNGAGKSTLFRLLLLLERADAGRIVLDGRAVEPGDTAAMRRMAGVFQRPFLFQGSVEENVAFGLVARGVRGAERRARVREALSWLGVESLAARPVRELSGGEAQRVALARALVAKPDVLVLDEPTANLDVAVRRRFREDLERLARTRVGAAILITHDPTDAFSLADRIAVMEGGRIVQEDTPESLVLAPATPFVAAFTGAELLLDGMVCAMEDELVTVNVGGAGATVVASAPTEQDRARLVTGSRVHVAYRPEDVVLAAPEDGALTSAINRFGLEVGAMMPAGGLVRVRLEGQLQLTALLTRRSAETLGLFAGKRVQAQMKATALRVFPAA